MGLDLLKFLPQKVCYCLDFNPGIKILLIVIIVLRFVAMIMGCFYGPYVYAVLPLGGLYLAADGLLLHAVFGAFSRNGSLRSDDEEDGAQAEDDSQCDFKTQRVWIFVWLALNIVALIGLVIAIGLFGDLGTWAMSHQPIHFALFIWIIILSALLIYTHFIITALYMYLKDAWLQTIIGGPWEDSQPGLTSNGKRVVVH